MKKRDEWLITKKIKCPDCDTEIEEDVSAGMSCKCPRCGSVFLYMPDETKVSGSPNQEQMLEKVMKCPHCDKLILLKIPIKIDVDFGDMTKKAVERCPKCKGRKVIKVPGPGDGSDMMCDKCTGTGVISLKKPEKPDESKDNKKNPQMKAKSNTDDK